MNDNDPTAGVRRVRGPTIRLFGGTYFSYDDPDGSDYTIEDIAHGLSHQCRFAGHTAWHYSVAQHSVLASHIVAPEFAYDTLMHDAPEFVVTDLVKPLKNTLPDFMAVETRIEASVFARFHVTNPLPEAVKIADLQMLKAEQRQLMNAANDDWNLGVDEPAIKIGKWPSAYAKERFLERFWQLAMGKPASNAAWGLRRLAA